MSANCLSLSYVVVFFYVLCLFNDMILLLELVKVSGGSIISVKVRWSQKLLYQDDQFCLNVPFSFQPYVNPVGKKVPKREKILLNVNFDVGLEIFCRSSSHNLKVSVFCDHYLLKI